MNLETRNPGIFKIILLVFLGFLASRFSFYV